MNTAQIFSLSNEEYNYIEKVIVGNFGEITEKIHPLLKCSSILAIKTFKNCSNNQFVQIFPSKLEYAPWIATICVLYIIKNNFEVISRDINFTKGQQLVVDNKHVVEYLGEGFNSQQGKKYVYVKCKDLTRYGIPYDLKLLYQPITTEKKLSLQKNVSSAIQQIRSQLTSLDSILDISTLGNKALFNDNCILVSKIGETNKFIKETQFNGTQLIDLFLWGKLDPQGEVSIVNQQDIKGDPSCLIAPDLYSTLNYLNENKDKTKCVIIDGTSNIKNNGSIFSELLDTNIPVMIVTDPFDAEYFDYLAECGFLFWNWNNTNLLSNIMDDEIEQATIFTSEFNSVRNYCNQSIEHIHCNNIHLNQLVEEVISLRNDIPDDQDELNIPYRKLIRILNEISRIIRVPNESWNENRQISVEKIRQEFHKQRIWLKNETKNRLDRIFEMLLDLLTNPLSVEENKVTKLAELIVDSRETLVVVTGSDEAQLTQDYWENENPGIDFSKIKFIDVQYLKNIDERKIPERIIICGWLGTERMYSILHSYICPEYLILEYPFEKRWYKSANHHWKKKIKVKTNIDELKEIYSIDEKFLNITELDVTENENHEQEKDNDLNIVEFEYKLRRNIYREYLSSREDSEDTIKAKLVVFSNDRFVFITESHLLPVVTDIIGEENSDREILRKSVDDLTVGDFVIFQESTRDILSELAEKTLTKSVGNDIYAKSRLWREELRKVYHYLGPKGIVQSLTKEGCKRHPATINKWLFDDSQIGPGNKNDIRSIARVTKSKQLAESIDEVWNAISVIRGAHIQASHFLRSKLLSKLPSIIDQQYSTMNDLQSLSDIDMEEFGIIHILQIDEISNEWEEVSKYSTNTLLTEDI